MQGFAVDVPEQVQLDWAAFTIALDATYDSWCNVEDPTDVMEARKSAGAANRLSTPNAMLWGVENNPFTQDPSFAPFRQQCHALARCGGRITRDTPNPFSLVTEKLDTTKPHVIYKVRKGTERERIQECIDNCRVGISEHCMKPLPDTAVTRAFLGRGGLIMRRMKELNHRNHI